MSGQCLSPSETGHALTPATHHRLGRPLPYQLASTTQSAPEVESHLWSEDIIRHYLQFPAAIPVLGVRNYALLSLSPLSPALHPSHLAPRESRGLNEIGEGLVLARLACLIHAANVHSEPGSNPSIGYCFTDQRIHRSKLADQSMSLLKKLDGFRSTHGTHHPPVNDRGLNDVTCLCQINSLG